MKTQKPSHKKLKAYHTERWRDIHKNLESYFRTASNESLHAARVETKRLTVLFRFIGYCDENFEGVKKLKPLQKIFKLLGELRTFKNEDLFCKKFKIDKDILKKEFGKQDKIGRELRSKYNKYRERLRRTEKQAKAIIKTIPERKLKEYLDKIMLNLKASLGQNITINLHHHRKRIKEAVYLAKMAESMGARLVSRAEIDLLDQLQDEIGKWHDLVIFSGKMKRIKDAAVQLKFLETLEKEENRQLQVIIKLGRDFAAR